MVIFGGLLINKYMNGFEYFLNYFSEKLKYENFQLSKRIPYKLYEPVTYSLDIGGKRIRPILVLMSYNLFKPDFEKALPVAFAIELFHNFTLLHDDIMDNANLRRNNETVHVKYSKNAAILSGDAMSILSYEYLSRCESDNLNEILVLYTQTALKICEGQQLDMDFESNNQITVNDYLNMIGLKTAVLLASSLKLGALIANAPTSESNCLYEFGFNLGLAFQLQDDLLDTFGNEDEFGKNIGGDIISNKKTFLLLTALNIANESQKRELHNWLSASNFDNKEKIRNVKKIFSELEIEQITRLKVEYYYQVATDWWKKLDVEPDKKNRLIEVANLLMTRRK
jgi:geranylgeranyl diphosphate synthase, type II